MGSKGPKQVTDLLREVRDFYIKVSRDFNGLAFGANEPAERIAEAVDLVRQALVQVVTGEDYLNPHIRPWQSQRSVESQVASLEHGGGCLYPTPAGMKSVRLPVRFKGRPYEQELAKGRGVLELAYFTPDVLEFYRNDPRYQCRIGDFSVYMSVDDDTYGDEGEPEKDKVSLPHMGFAYDLSRYDRDDESSPILRRVAAFVGDLARLTPEHQQRWKTYQVPDGDLSPHPEWFANQMGHWTDGIGPFGRMFLELEQINELFVNIGSERLFAVDEAPDEYGWILRPAQRDWDDFIRETDKLLSENLRHAAFDALGIDDKDEQRQKLGTIKRLELLMERSQVPTDAITRYLKPLREVRTARQKPAHNLRTNLSDKTLVHRQVNLMRDINQSLVNIAGWLSQHPSNRDYEFKDKGLEDFRM